MLVLVFLAQAFAASGLAYDVFGSTVGLSGFKTPPRCPRGTEPVASKGLQPYRCMRVNGILSEAEAAALKPEPVPPPQIPTEGLVASTRRFEIAGEMNFEYPARFQSRDSWNEDVPTLLFSLDDPTPGKPVNFTLSLMARSQAGYMTVEESVAKDKQWRNAKEISSIRVAGIKARVTEVAGESMIVYVPRVKDAYYVIVYSAPMEKYNLHLGDFRRLLKTFRLSRRGH
ncbi:MAG: hypothetical protein AAB036_00360 [Elusimicrobiota bacterium]|mgnify:CR=1 FL=1